MNLNQKVEFFRVVLIVERNLVVVIISAMKLVIQVAAANVNFYQAGLRRAVVGKQSWMQNGRVVWIQYLPAHKYVASAFVVGYMIVPSHAMLGTVHHVRSKFHRNAAVAPLPELWSAIKQYQRIRNLLVKSRVGQRKIVEGTDAVKSAVQCQVQTLI